MKSCRLVALANGHRLPRMNAASKNVEREQPQQLQCQQQLQRSQERINSPEHPAQRKWPPTPAAINAVRNELRNFNHIVEPEGAWGRLQLFVRQKQHTRAGARTRQNASILASAVVIASVIPATTNAIPPLCLLSRPYPRVG